MKNLIYIRYLIALTAIFTLTYEGQAQTEGALSSEEAETFLKGVNFNGLGRVYLRQTDIEGDVLENDSLTPRRLTDGEFLLDLKINATPNKKTEVQSILRLRNEFGGFFGAGQSIEVRELWARGLIADVIEYRVGDMDIEMSPFTFYLPKEESTINQPSAFGLQKDVIYYEQFYTDDNTRRMQGANLNFGLKFSEVLRDADFKGFIARVRGTDFLTIPTRWVSGGEARFRTREFSDVTGSDADIRFNLVHTFDDLQSGDANTGIRNTVYSMQYDITGYETENMAYSLFGELGRSELISKNDSVTFYSIDDVFFTVNGRAKFKKKDLVVHAGYSEVGPDFFSIGAQSKRVDFDATQSTYNRIGPDQEVRDITLFDLSRDVAVYTYQLSDRLMTYDPRFSNTFPYGPATPNRRGLNYGGAYKNEIVEAGINGALMSEIRGQGTEELKDFFVIQASVDLSVNEYFELDKNLMLTLGYQFENTSRGGIEVEQIDLNSNLVEAGIEVEIFDDFELLFGAKILDATGSEYIPRIDEFNIVRDFPARTQIDDRETLLAGGLKYTFKEGIYLTLQYQSFNADGRTDTFRDYRLNQIFALYTMKF